MNQEEKFEKGLISQGFEIEKDNICPCKNPDKGYSYYKSEYRCCNVFSFSKIEN
jgi:hypothetical protein